MSELRRSNILIIIGTRPEAIKLAPVILELRRRELDGQAGGYHPVVCLTGQHREMARDVLKLFGITPDYDLKIMKPTQSPSYVASAIFKKLPQVIEATRPEWLVVQGDTTSVAAAALCAYYNGVKVAHVEAGLRSHNKWAPFPEEINRKVAGVVADLHFAPTEAAKRNLISEGISEDSIHVTGNTVIDALYMIASYPPPRSLTRILKSCAERVQGKKQARELVPREENLPRIILATTHRRESFGEPMREVFRALRDIATEFSDDTVLICPVHRNPVVRSLAQETLGDAANVLLIPPLDYATLIHLMKRCYLVITDSGGIQEEAPAFGKPVLVTREVTEREEGVEAGVAVLVGTSRDRIVQTARSLLTDEQQYARMARVINPYGDGKAAARIVSCLLDRKQFFKQRK